MKKLLFGFFCLISLNIFGQNPPPQSNPPWERPLMIARSTDGRNFTDSKIFMDSSGVPHLIQDRSGRLIAVFQWFPAPMRSANWDKVAVCFSNDKGRTWTKPVPIQIPNLPAGFQRPFDPTLALTETGKIRIYFSASPAPTPTLNNTVATYSAISDDGITYQFEAGIRFGNSSKAVVDPAITFFKGLWYYTAPKGAPQEGAFHATSKDGLIFEQKSDIPSDNTHQWTGNLISLDNEMRFYGGGRNIWFSSSTNGTTWSGFTDLSIGGGDPAVIKIDNEFLMIYVGMPYATTPTEDVEKKQILAIFPNPSKGIFQVKNSLGKTLSLEIFDVFGKKITEINLSPEENRLDLQHLPKGVYRCVSKSSEIVWTQSLLIE